MISSYANHPTSIDQFNMSVVESKINLMWAIIGNIFYWIGPYKKFSAITFIVSKESKLFTSIKYVLNLNVAYFVLIILIPILCFELIEVFIIILLKLHKNQSILQFVVVGHQIRIFSSTVTSNKLNLVVIDPIQRVVFRWFKAECFSEVDLPQRLYLVLS